LSLDIKEASGPTDRESVNVTRVPQDLPAAARRDRNGRSGLASDDRARLADELHDGPVQLAVTVALELETVQRRLEAEGKLIDPLVAAALQRSKRVILEAVAELRTIVKQLHTEGRPRTVRRRPGGRRPDPTRVPDEEVTT